MELNYEIVGCENQPSIIVLHGLFGSISNWRQIAKTLAHQYQVISVDLRNHGASPWNDDMSYTAMAQDIKHFIEEKNLQSPHILGHSMGGKVLMTLAQQSDIALGKLFVIDIAPVQYQHDHGVILSAMASVDFSQLHSRKAVSAALSKYIHNIALRQFIMQNLRRNGDQFSWRLNVDAIIANMDKIMGYDNQSVSTVDILFIAGSHSDYIDEMHKPATLRLFPQATFTVIDNAGHWLHSEQPEQLLQVLFKQLEQYHADN